MTYYRQKIDLQTEPHARKVFFAEGLSEALFLSAVLSDAGYDAREYAVFCFKGVDNLSVALQGVATDANFDNITSVGIMIDADADASARLDKAKAALLKSEIIDDLAVDLSDQNIATINGRRIGVYISPGNSMLGTIEDMICAEIAGKPEYDCISEFSECLTNRHGIVENKKAVAQWYMALKKPTLSGVGRGFEAGVFDTSDDAYEPAVAMFLRL